MPRGDPRGTIGKRNDPVEVIRQEGEVGGQIGIAPEIIENDSGKQVHCCSECGYDLTLLAGDPKSGTVVRSIPIESVSPLNHYGLVDTVEIREYACPSCAHLLSVAVRLQDEPPLLDTFLNPIPEADRSIAAE